MATAVCCLDATCSVNSLDARSEQAACNVPCETSWYLRVWHTTRCQPQYLVVGTASSVCGFSLYAPAAKYLQPHVHKPRFWQLCEPREARPQHSDFAQRSLMLTWVQGFINFIFRPNLLMREPELCALLGTLANAFYHSYVSSAEQLLLHAGDSCQVTARAVTS